jgi:hypothetical protein
MISFFADRPSSRFIAPQSALIHQTHLSQLVRWICVKLGDLENMKLLEKDTRFAEFIEVFRDILNRFLLAIEASLYPLQITLV